MNSDSYNTLLESAIEHYTKSKGFLGYFYPGQFYDFTKRTKAFSEVTGANSYRWMISLEDVCSQREGLTFSKLSPAKEGERSNTDHFGKLLGLGQKWHKEGQKGALAVYVAKGMGTDRRIALSELSRYFGGVNNLSYLVSKTTLKAKDFPCLIRAHYKDLISKLANNNWISLQDVYAD